MSTQIHSDDVNINHIKWPSYKRIFYFLIIYIISFRITESNLQIKQINVSFVDFS